MKTDSDMINVVKELLRESLQLGERVNKMTVDTPLLGSIPELDSMAVLTILTLFEDRFGLAVDDGEVSADTFATVGSLADFLRKHVRV